MLALAAAMTFAVLPYGALPAADAVNVVRNGRSSCAKRGQPGEAIGTYRVFVRNLVFYTGLKHTDMIHDEHMKDWL